MTRIEAPRMDGPSTRQTLAVGLLAGLGAAVIHGFACSAHITGGQEAILGHPPLSRSGEASALASGRLRYALLLRPVPHSPGTGPGAPPGPIEIKTPGRTPGTDPALLWRL